MAERLPPGATPSPQGQEAAKHSSADGRGMRAGEVVDANGVVVLAPSTGGARATGAPLDDAVLPQVFDALGSADPSERRTVTRHLVAAAVTPALLAMLERALRDDTNLARRSAAMETLAAMKAPALPLLGRLSKDVRPAVRRLAVDALGLTREAGALPHLERCLSDELQAVRAAALEAIARTGAPGAAAILARVIEGTSEQAAVVLAALLGIGDSDRLPSHAALLRWSKDPLTAPTALKLLGRTGDVATLLEGVQRLAGSRRKAAVVGLAHALELRGATAAAKAELRTPPIRQFLCELIDASDIQNACAALIVSAFADNVDALALAAARDDRAHLASAAHRAAGILAQTISDLPARLHVLQADDPPGADLLREIADGVSSAGIRGEVPARGTTRGPLRIDDASFAQLRRLLEETAGIEINEDARTRLEARLLPRAEKRGFATFAAYVSLLMDRSPAGRAEWLEAVDVITVHETYFFRERVQLVAFRDEVVPAIAQPGRPLAVWSAGCSTGEEAYSIAMLLREMGQPDAQVLGTDIAPSSIRGATAGRYGPHSFRGEIDPAIRRKWFIYELNGVSVQPAVRAQTRFEILNLADRAAASRVPPMDAIFCRNVLIYLSADARRNVIRLFYETLRPGGVLLLGHSESLLNVDTPFRLWPLKGCLVYRKPGPDSSGAKGAR